LAQLIEKVVDDLTFLRVHGWPRLSDKDRAIR
jgi:hypothetical protein